MNRKYIIIGLLSILLFSCIIIIIVTNNTKSYDNFIHEESIDDIVDRLQKSKPSKIIYNVVDDPEQYFDYIVNLSDNYDYNNKFDIVESYGYTKEDTIIVAHVISATVGLNNSIELTSKKIDTFFDDVDTVVLNVDGLDVYIGIDRIKNLGYLKILE